MEAGIKNVQRELRVNGLNPDFQGKLDRACITPHIHPRHLRNEEPKSNRKRIRLYGDIWVTEYT